MVEKPQTYGVVVKVSNFHDRDEAERFKNNLQIILNNSADIQGSSLIVHAAVKNKNEL